MGTENPFTGEAQIQMRATQLREELETAWLRGWATATQETSPWARQAAADYAERVVGGSTGPAEPDPLSTPSKDENSSQGAQESV